MEDLKNPVELEAERLIATDGAIVDPETGECFGYVDAPEADREEERTVDWYLEKRAYAAAELKGIRAAEAELIRGIQDRYGVQAREQEARMAWLDSSYLATTESYGRKSLGAEAKTIEDSNKILAVAKVKNVKRPFAKLQFSSSRESTNIVDAWNATAWLVNQKILEPLRITLDLAELDPSLRANVIFALFKGKPATTMPAGAKFEILVSKIPDDRKEALPEDGFTFMWAGKDQSFKIDH